MKPIGGNANYYPRIVTDSAHRCNETFLSIPASGQIALVKQSGEFVKNVPLPIFHDFLNEEEIHDVVTFYETRAIDS